jgi:ABC-2 type transport system permease protein
MFTELLKFELEYRLRLVSTHIYFTVLFLFAAYTVVGSSGVIPGTMIYLGDWTGKLYINSPFTVNYLVTTLCFIGLFVLCSFMISAVNRDFQYGTHSLYFTKPISPRAYLAARFLGSVLCVLYVFSAVGLGGLFAALLPIYPAGQVGPFHLLTYVRPYAVNVLPNVLFLGGVFFALAVVLRRSMPVFTAGLGFILLHIIARNLAGEERLAKLLSLVDPLGFVAYSSLTGRWIASERNTVQIPLAGDYLTNRLLWLGVGACFLVIGFWRFRFAEGLDRSPVSAPIPSDPEIRSGSIIAPHRDFSRPAFLRMMLEAALFDLWAIIRSIYFHLILAGVALSLIAITLVHTMRWGTPSYPVTYEVLEFLDRGFPLFLLVMISVYAGELIWRERENRSHEVYDALPVPRWVFLSSKILALMGMQAVIAVSVALTGMITQASQGYYRFEPALYAKELLLIKMTEYWLFCVVALFTHVVIHHKYVAHFVVALFYIVLANLSQLGIHHNLLHFASDPGYVYSDMNGYGHFVWGLFWFKVYWAAAALLLVLAAYAVWPRGCETSLLARLRLLPRRLTPRFRGTAVGALAPFVGLAGWIFYNTNIVNSYVTPWDSEEWAATYEKSYGWLRDIPQPKVTEVDVQVDIYPSARALHASGSMVLTNRNQAPINRLFVTLPRPEMTVTRLSPLSGHRLTRKDAGQGVYEFDLSRPLGAGEQLRLAFDLKNRVRGFENGIGDTSVVANGSFINSLHLLPHIGYMSFRELEGRTERLSHGLQAERQAGGVAKTVISDSDWISLNTVVGTESDQVAIAPGELKREWSVQGRRYFHYRVEHPVQKVFAVLSARYEVKRANWRDVKIEVYHDPNHSINVGRMMAAVKRSLEYYSRSFGPYPHDSVRIAEFPRFARFAQYFPGLIPFSESAGFIAWVRPGRDSVDVPFAVTAHELAHEWWGQQVRGANVPGEQMLTETLANYSATMVLRREFPEMAIRKMLNYELDDYLWGRANEGDEEIPLSRVSDDYYIAYQKGRLAMCALEDYIGEDTVNRAMASYLATYRYQGPPYPVATDLIDRLRQVTPPEFRYLVSDLFESVALYENKAVRATCRRQTGGNYQVVLDVESRKIYSDGHGRETQVPIADWIDIGVQVETGDWAHLQRCKMDQEKSRFTIDLKQRPVRAGIDPCLKLIDRHPEDNSVPVVEVL